MKISTTALWHNKNKLYWLPVFGKTPSSVWVEWGAWLLEIVVRRRTPLALDGANAPDFQQSFPADVLDGDGVFPEPPRQ